MKKQIRNNVFETNSSSTHAICISKNNNYEKCDYVRFETGEFGWEWKTYDGINSKASYLITAILSRNKEESDININKLKDMLERNNIEYSIPNPSINSYKCNNKDVTYYDINGYIDHASETKEFVDAVLSNDDLFMKYLFGDSFILTGNDNDYYMGLNLPSDNNYDIFEKDN